MPSHPLQQELDYFESMRMRWVDGGLEGRWALVRGKELLGHYGAAETAYEKGIELVGISQEFLVKQVLEEDIEHKNPALAIGALRVDR